MVDEASPSAPPVAEGHMAVAGPLFIAASQVDLIITEKLVVGSGSPVVTDVNGNVVFKIKGSFFSSHRHIVDNANRPVVSIHPKMSLHSRCHVFRGDSREMRDLVCMVKQMSHFSAKTLGVFLPANSTNEEVPDFRIKRSWLDRSCTVYLGNSNTIIAQMRKKHGFFTTTNSLTVCPNVDYAFIVALAEVISVVTPKDGAGAGNG